MRIIISESQYKILKESKNKKVILALIEDKGLHGASEFLGIPVYELIEMGVVEHYDGDLYLDNVPIKSLGELKYVGGTLAIINCKQLSSFGKLRSVGKILFIRNCPLSKLSDEEIRSQVEIKGEIYR